MKPYVQSKNALVVKKLFAGDTVSCMWSSRRAVYGFTRLFAAKGDAKNVKEQINRS